MAEGTEDTAGSLVVVLECEGTDRQTVSFNPERAEGYWLARVEELARKHNVDTTDVNIRFAKAPPASGWVR